MAQKQKIYIPTYISSIDYKPARVLPHVYFWNGMRETDTFYVQSYTSGSNNNSITASAIEQFPYFDNYNVTAGQTFPSSGSLSLLFNNEVAQYGTTPSSSLYSEYWSSYVNLLYNPRTRLIDCSAIIPLADYFKMELNDIVEWRGNYYHLRAINDYNLSNGECQLQLLGPIISDTLSAVFGGTCTFGFSSNVYIPSGSTTTTTTTAGPTTTTTTTAGPTTTTTTTAGPSTTTTTTAGPTTTTTTLSNTYTIEYLVVAGGGGGGYSNNTGAPAGGGGAGGWVSGSMTVTASTLYPAVVGAGGSPGILSGPVQAQSGSISSFGSDTARGGGRGGSNTTAPFQLGGNGGSGGGGCGSAAGGSGYSTQGTNGASGGSQSGITYGGSGGGAGTGATTFPFRPGTGKTWLDGSIYAAGGAGRNATPQYSAQGKGGQGGDAYGSYGDSGIVALRYAGTQRGSGGYVYEAGGYTYHLFSGSANYIA